MEQKAHRIVIDARNRRSSTGRYTDRLIENLEDIDKTNHYTILVEPDDDWPMRNPNFQTVPCRFQQFSFSPIEQIGFAWQLYRLRPDLVHFSMTQQPLLYFGKIVTTTHDLTMFRYTRPSRFPVWLHKVGMVFYRFLFWWSHHKSSRIIVPTKYVRDDLAKFQPFTRRKVSVIYEAGDSAIRGRSEPVKGVRQPFIMHVGAPLPHKNIERLIQAFAITKQKNPNLQLVLPGRLKDPFKTDFDKWVAASPAKDSILPPGFVSDEQLKWLYENAEAYVLPSLSEGFGLPGLEAMAHGCPLVSSNATCMPEVYGDAAQYFDPRDIDNMAEKISKVVGYKSLQKDLVVKGKKQVLKYSWPKMARETLDIYRGILSH